MVSEDTDGYLGRLNAEQEITLAKFKAVINTLAAKKWGYDLSQFDDYDYLRFLRARKFGLKEASVMFNKYIQWRKDFEVDKIYVLRTIETQIGVPLPRTAERQGHLPPRPPQG